MKDYYGILGVSRAAEGEDIREAYRDMVKRCHPDSSQTSDTVPTFLDVQEAYDVLRDSDRRREYDRDLDSSPRRRTRSHGWVYSERPKQSNQPFKPREPFGAGAPFGAAEPFARRGSHWGTGLDELDLELSPDEARRGGRVSLPLASGRRCPMCGGAGAVFVFRCGFCRGTGRVGGSSRVVVHIPTGARTGDHIVGYDRFGEPTADIRVVVR